MKWFLYIATIFLITATLVIMFALTYNKAHSFTFFKGVTINNQELKGLNKQVAITKFQKQVDEFLKQGLVYNYQDQEIVIYPTLPATSDPDASYSLINFNIEDTINEAYLIGREEGYHLNFFKQMWALTFGKNISLNYELNKEELLNILEDNFKQFSKPKKEARPVINDIFEISILPEQAGTTFDYDLILTSTIERINNLSLDTINLSLAIDEPLILENDINQEVLNGLEEIIATSTFMLVYNDDNWAITNSIFKDWLIFKKHDDKIGYGFKASSTFNYLDTYVAPNIYQPTLDAKFEIVDGRVVEFVGSQDGLELDNLRSLEKIEEDFLINKISEIDLVVIETKAKIETGEVNDMGITEIIGTGHSNFSGSPRNRRHNIRIGAESISGLLISPGEEFSLIDALGDINGATGYLQELVIKGNKTIPEYGGGLCQIGTTVFRAVLGSGLPVTARRNHSYRVSYYEPAGTDATIYDPYPDFKFKNDTENNVLIQYRIEGDDLYFDFWGTTDGRVSERTDPTIYNITSPGPIQYIETTELEVGKTNCTESAHNGADAYFDYKVTYPDGNIQEERFSSHYVAWPARCLIGVEELSTSTDEILE
ncbi:hypothetical protein HN800_00515 [bacterium]|nr:hypothetical protein [bacterium]MBT4335674.1 hypothetical protein [bacterium]MBT4495851.1 hypothetical protein [bacterium]MBT5400942.1 hypothetical protein [bacterium]MBT5942261.1 hypothetical protein [bacterium]